MPIDRLLKGQEVIALKSLKALLTVLSLCIVAAAGIKLSYSSSFPYQQNPINEGQMWINGHSAGVEWADVASYPGKAWGLEGMDTPGGYSDATAVLKGVWNESQGASAKVFTTTPPHEGSPCYPEVELRLHTSIAAYSIKGYEVTFSVGGTSSAYGMIVRWNGPLGSFTVLAWPHGSAYGVRNGDTVSATYSNGTITAYKNGVAMMSAYDTTYAYSGGPGIGFNYSKNLSCPGGTGKNDTYGFSSFWATE